MDTEEQELKRKIYQLENQISALSDQAWSFLRDGRTRMKELCTIIDAGNTLSESELKFLRAMIGCILAELSCRAANA